MDCQFVKKNDLLERHILGQLGDSEERRFVEHIEQCAACRKKLTKQRELIVGIRSVGLAEMKQEIRAHVAALESETTDSWMQWAKVAAVLFVIVGSSSVYVVFRDQGREIVPLGTLEVRQPAQKELPLAASKAEDDVQISRSEPQKSEAVLLMSQDVRSLREIKGKKFERAKPIGLQKSLGKKAVTERLFEEAPPSETQAIGPNGQSMASLQQTRPATLSGKVTDRAGNPLPGANVVIKSTKIGVATDLNGNYVLNLPDTARGQPVVIEALFIGYRAARDTVVLSESPFTQNFTLEAEVLEMAAITVISTFDQTEQAQPRSRTIPSMAADSSVPFSPRKGNAGLLSFQSAEEPPAWSFETNGKTILVRVRQSGRPLSTKEGTRPPTRFPVTIVKRAASELEMNWLLPAGFLKGQSEIVLLEMSSSQSIRVVLRAGHVYTIDLKNDATVARLRK